MAQNEQALLQWFRQVDKDGSGKIDSRELQAALALGNLRFSLQTTAHMIRNHDQDNSGQIDFREFQSLHAFLINMQSSFRYFDRDAGGTLCQQEVLQALQHGGFRLDPPAFNKMFHTFDPDRVGSLNLEKYISMTLYLQSCWSTFAAFDTAKQNKINLDFSQFVYACANCS